MYVLVARAGPDKREWRNMGIIICPFLYVFVLQTHSLTYTAGSMFTEVTGFFLGCRYVFRNNS